jgi:hypothetical protein
MDATCLINRALAYTLLHFGTLDLELELPFAGEEFDEDDP